MISESCLNIAEWNNTITELYTKYRSRLVEYVKKVFRVLNDAYDIVQDVFTYLWEHCNNESIAKYPNVWVFLRTCVHNAACKNFNNLTKMPMVNIEQDAIQNQHNLTTTFANTMDFDITLKKIIKNIQEQQPITATDGIANVFDGKSSTEIASTTDRRINAVKKNITRFREILGKLIGRSWFATLIIAIWLTTMPQNTEQKQIAPIHIGNLTVAACSCAFSVTTPSWINIVPQNTKQKQITPMYVVKLRKIAKIDGLDNEDFAGDSMPIAFGLEIYIDKIDKSEKGTEVVLKHVENTKNELELTSIENLSFESLVNSVVPDREVREGAAATSQVSGNGQSCRCNNITVDGLDNNDPSNGSVRTTFGKWPNILHVATHGYFNSCDDNYTVVIKFTETREKAHFFRGRMNRMLRLLKATKDRE